MDRLGTARWTLPFRVLRAPISIHVGWLLVAVLIAWTMAMKSLPAVYSGLSGQTYWMMAAVVIAGLGLSILAHAFVHALAARAMGITVERVTLFVFGGVTELRETPRSVLSELGLATVGPLISVVLSGLIAFAAGASDLGGASDLVVGSLTFIATLNLIMAVFNLLPAFPLDGGRALRSLMWLITGDLHRATRIATGVAVALSVLLMVSGIVQAARGALEGGLWTMLIGIFLQHAARAAQFDADARQILATHRLGVPRAS